MKMAGHVVAKAAAARLNSVDLNTLRRAVGTALRNRITASTMTDRDGGTTTQNIHYTSKIINLYIMKLLKNMNLTEIKQGNLKKRKNRL